MIKPHRPTHYILLLQILALDARESYLTNDSTDQYQRFQDRSFCIPPCLKGKKLSNHPEYATAGCASFLSLSENHTTVLMSVTTFMTPVCDWFFCFLRPKEDASLRLTFGLIQK